MLTMGGGSKSFIVLIEIVQLALNMYSGSAKGPEYSTLIEMYIKFILESFGADSIIILDGYPDASTKDPCHRKRSGTEIGPTIDVKVDNKLTISKKMFLNNVKN